MCTVFQLNNSPSYLLGAADMNWDPKGRHTQLFLVGTENFTDVILEQNQEELEAGKTQL